MRHSTLGVAIVVALLAASSLAAGDPEHWGSGFPYRCPDSDNLCLWAPGQEWRVFIPRKDSDALRSWQRLTDERILLEYVRRDATKLVIVDNDGWVQWSIAASSPVLDVGVSPSGWVVLCAPNCDVLLASSNRIVHTMWRTAPDFPPRCRFPRFTDDGRLACYELESSTLRVESQDHDGGFDRVHLEVPQYPDEFLPLGDYFALESRNELFVFDATGKLAYRERETESTGVAGLYAAKDAGVLIHRVNTGSESELVLLNAYLEERAVWSGMMSRVGSVHAFGGGLFVELHLCDGHREIVLIDPDAGISGTSHRDGPREAWCE